MTCECRLCKLIDTYVLLLVLLNKMLKHNSKYVLIIVKRNVNSARANLANQAGAHLRFRSLGLRSRIRIIVAEPPVTFPSEPGTQ